MEIEHSFISKKISSIFGKPTLDLFASRINYQIDGYISWKPDSKALAIDSSSIKWNTEFYYIFPPYLAREGESKNLQRQNESHCSDPKMAHTTLVPQPLEKSDKKHDYNTINKKFGTTPGSTKSAPTTSKASPTSTPDRLTTQDSIHASLRKSTCQKYLSYQTHWKEFCTEKNNL